MSVRVISRPLLWSGKFVFVVLPLACASGNTQPLQGVASSAPVANATQSALSNSSTPSPTLSAPSNVPSAVSSFSAGASSNTPSLSGAPSVAASLSAAVSASAAASVAAAPTTSASQPSECVPFVMPTDCTIPEGSVLPGDLRCTGLYADWPARKLHCSVVEYTPAYTLWSDGSEKYRYVSLPVGKQVDVTNPDDFRYPIGTQFWKEFRVPEGTGFRLGETRLMRRVDGGWLYTTYVWSEDGSSAVQQNEGVADLFKSGHTVPARQQCKDCHQGRRDYVLGWDALMLGEGAKGITRQSLLSDNWITWQGKDTGEPSPLNLTVPGDSVERAALGYLHANCGVSCHNDTTASLALETGFFTRLDADTLSSVVNTDTFKTGLNRQPQPNAPLKDLALAPDGGQYIDLRPLDTAHSLTLVRMKLRNVEAAMPRIGTNRVDKDGVALVQAWIESMTKERGYPSPMP